ncbi:MAG: ribonuclease III [Acidobacteria bacterium]|nr:MAG: ribonuclease III [Acidobacteriota bacterium]PYV02209.1 MAG: ribonuclease III [Acidobacteriota bacterium]PYV25232.1 MAG: ribonuclease III [Acidobacteriota bacterium]
MAKPSLKSLQAHLSYRFRNCQLLLEALTHSSYAREASDRVRDNERMEFLGDAVLNFLVSVRLADTFPQYSEGSLSRARARLVSAEHLAKVAGAVELGKYLRLGRGEKKTGGQTKAALLANAVEALLAALYRDGGLEAAQAFVERFILPADLGAKADELLSIDYKSALQEYLQAQHLHLATYRVANEEGPEHRKTFTVEAAAGENWRALGGGASKKVAEQEAARNLLALIRKKAELHG